MKQIILFSLIFCVFIGCSNNEVESTKIKYGMTQFERKFGNCDSANAGCASVLFEFPQIKYAISSSVKDSISNYFLDEFLNTYGGGDEIKSLDKLANSMFKDYQTLSRDFPDTRQSWEIQGTASLIYNDNFIVSVQTDIYLYTGGAHPNSQTNYANFNSKNGKRILLADILNENFIKELNIIAEKIFRGDNNFTSEQSLEEEGYWFFDNKFSLNENFGIKNDGLVFYFNSYEIAPYSMGPTEVFVPYADIENLIKLDGLLSPVADK